MFNEQLIKMTNSTEFLRAIPCERARTFLECDCRVRIVECYVESMDIGATVYHREMPQNAKVTKMVGFEVFYGKKLAPNGTYLVFQKPEVCPEGYFVVCTDHWRILDANRLYQLEPQNGGEPTFTRMAKNQIPKAIRSHAKSIPELPLQLRRAHPLRRNLVKGVRLWRAYRHFERPTNRRRV